MVEPFALIRSGLCSLLKDLDDGVSFIEAGRVDDVLELDTDGVQAELALVTSDLPPEGMLSQISELHARLPETRIVLLTEGLDGAAARRAIAAGASGFIPKSANTQVMISALKLILSGEVFIPSSIFESAQSYPGGPSGLRANKRPPGRLGELSQRQMEVLTLLAAGKSNSAIAKELQIEPGTVKNHVQAILRTLKVHNRTQAVRIAVDAGLMPLGPIPIERDSI